MKNDQTSLDVFIVSPVQRDITRALRFLLYTVEFSDHVLVFGEREVAAHLLRMLALCHPDPGRHVGLIEKTAAGATLTMGTDTAPASSPDATVPQLIRALIRQDPDVIAVNVVDDKETADLLITAALTGHQIFYTAQAETLDEALGALATLIPEMGGYVRPGIVVKVGGAGYIEQVWCRTSAGDLEAMVSIANDEVVVKRELLPPVPYPTPLERNPKFSAPVETWVPATKNPRTAFIPVVDAEAKEVSCIGGTKARLPHNEAWPVCGDCGLPLTLLLELDLTMLPESYRKADGLAQLFICGEEGGGCEKFSETDPGILATVRPRAGLVDTPAPVSVYNAAVSSGGVVGWKEYTEDPDYADEEGAENDTEIEAEAKLATAARSCDKLGGWPAWQQSNDWPLNDDGSRMTLLYQIAEGQLFKGGTTSGWDYEQAVYIHGDPGEQIVDPNFPHHFHSLWSGDAVGMLFIDTSGTKLALRVQMT